MLIQATQKYTRQAPRKVRLVASQVKGKSLTEAIEQLGLIERRASVVVMKVMRQAIANAVNNHGLAFTDLQIKNILVDEGASYKRFQPVSRGRAHSILKRSCHVTVQLETKPEAPKTAPAAKQATEKPAAPVKVAPAAVKKETKAQSVATKRTTKKAE